PCGKRSVGLFRRGDHVAHRATATGHPRTTIVSNASTSHRSGLYVATMKIAQACAANCFFAFMLFNAAAPGLAQEAKRSTKPAAEIRAVKKPNMETKNSRLAVHGVDGTIQRSSITPEKELEYRTGPEQALRAGYEILKRGGSSLDVTEAAVRVLEDDPHF